MAESRNALREDLRHRIEEARGYQEELEGLLSDLLQGDWLHLYLNDVLADVQAGSRAPLIDIGGDTIRLIVMPDIALDASLVGGRKAMLHSVPADRLMAFPDGSPAHVDIYEIEGSGGLDEFRADAALLLKESFSCNGLVVRQKRSERLVYDYYSPNDTICLKMTFYPADGLIWNFPRTTMRSSFPAMSGSNSSGLVILARVLGALGDRRADAWLDEISTDPSHAVRWSAVQAIARLDRKRGTAAIRRAINDPHPQIRASAARELQKLEGPADATS